jgi:hypothetical protein
MDGHQFDNLIRAFSAGRSRRGLVAAIAGLSAGSLLESLFAPTSVDAKNGKGKGKRKGKGKGKAKGKKKRPNCKDNKRNGGETDVDCGGGKCARCQIGQICNGPNDCASARCVGGTCQACVNNTECGVGPDGLQCACRLHVSGQKFCTNANGRFVAGATSCDVCTANEECFSVPGGIECVPPCGASA